MRFISYSSCYNCHKHNATHQKYSSRFIPFLSFCCIIEKWCSFYYQCNKKHHLIGNIQLAPITLGQNKKSSKSVALANQSLTDNVLASNSRNVRNNNNQKTGYIRKKRLTKYWELDLFMRAFYNGPSVKTTF